MSESYYENGSMSSSTVWGADDFFISGVTKDESGRITRERENGKYERRYLYEGDEQILDYRVSFPDGGKYFKIIEDFQGTGRPSFKQSDTWWHLSPVVTSYWKEDIEVDGYMQPDVPYTEVIVYCNSDRKTILRRTVTRSWDTYKEEELSDCSPGFY